VGPRLQVSGSQVSDRFMKGQNQNGPDPFPGRMLKEVTKAGFSFLFICVVVTFLLIGE